MLSRSAAVVKALLRLRSPLVSGEMLPRLIASTKTLGDPVYAMEVARAIPKGAMTSEGAAALHSLVTQGGKPFPWPIAYSLQFMGTRREAFYSGSSILFSQVHSHNLPNDLVVQDLACGEKKSLTEYRECAAKKLPGPYGWKVDPAIYCPCRRHMQLMNYLGYLPLGTSPWERIKKRATVTGRVIASCKSLLAAVKAPKHKKDPFRQCQPLSEFGRHTWQISESRRYKVMMQYGVPPLEATLRIGLTGSEQLRLKLLEQLWKKAPESYRKELKAISAAQLFDVLPRPVPTPEYAPYSLTPSEESERHKALLLPLEKHLADLARNQH
ncbi:hypothetical protein KKF84_14230 [Myxococcota bacterium]|nr:hypothetical protein [Myxococcota bacterium]